MAAFLKWISIGLAVLSPAPDNELYTGWANCKVGSWVKVKIINESTRLEMEVTFKLTDLSAEKAVVEGRHPRAEGRGGNRDRR